MCKYCHEKSLISKVVEEYVYDFIDVDNIIEENNYIVFIKGNNLCIINENFKEDKDLLDYINFSLTEQECLKINYCPMCGKKLKS